MSSESTYSVFRCNDNLVVFHQHGHAAPQTLIVFREPKRMALHDKKLIAVYPYSNDAEILLDDPGHDSAQILNAIALQLRADSKAALKRRLKGLACAVFRALITSAVWYLAPGDRFMPDSLSATVRRGSRQCSCRTRQFVQPHQPAYPAWLRKKLRLRR
ncbi:hypothetical protein [Leclercia adecarboxylata]|uniref:hypothetical protein n=1 Tax=Leclercia adecarboxylata TaxID=83655 RepID=UPI00294A7817|nr:hypothetical protein [Leclercia adecarboxylata]MDV5280061.1 hypothetical protein [Leclercia adecarboxylata]